MDIDTSPAAETGASAAEMVQAALRKKIIEGQLLPGSRLVDHALATKYDVSRNTVRDALRLLTTDGLVVSVRNAGSSVRVLNAADIHDIYSSRRLIESGAILQSSAAPDELLQDVRRAALLSQQHVDAGDWNKVGTASLQFHQSIVGLVRSERIGVFFGNLVAQLRLAFAVMPDESAFQVTWVSRDRDIAERILAGRRDEAAAMLVDYLNDSEMQIIDGIRAAEYSNTAVASY